MYSIEERSYSPTSGCFASASTIGGATYRPEIRCVWMASRNCARSKRGRTTTVAPQRSGAFMSAVRP